MNILITSIGRRSYMIDYFKKNLTEKDKILAVNNELTYALTKADDYAICPSIYENQYIPFLLDFCKKHKVNALISLFDIDLPILAKNKDKFDEIDVKLILSNEKFISICNDKWESFKFLKEHNFNVPKTYLSIDSFLNDFNNSQISYPVVVKPRFGMGSIGIEVADDLEELIFYYKKIKKIITSSYLKYESAFDIENAILIQQKINGAEYGLDVHNSLDGEYLVTIPKRKIAMRAGETDIAQVLKNPALIQLGQRLASVTKHIANLDVDVFIADEQIYILEMNARFGGQYPFTHLAGLDLTKVIVKQLNNLTLNANDLFFNEIKGSKDFTIVHF